MVGSFTDFAENKILDLQFGGVTWNVTSLHLGYFLSGAGEGGAGAEPVGSGYNRISTPPAYFSTSVDAEISTVADIICPKATGNQGNVIGVGFFDSSTGGNLISYVPLDGSILIVTADALIIPAGAITHRFIGGGFSDYLKNAILNHIYKGIPLQVEPILYGGYMITAPSDAAAGTEPAVGSYSRKPFNNSLITFNQASGGVKTTKVDIDFNLATAAQGDASHYGWWNSASGGQFLAHGPLDPVKSIGANDWLSIPAGDCVHTVD